MADILIPERIVLLYSPSGAGKTSLIQAGLLPRLKNEEKFDVLPIMRVRLKPPPDRQLPESFNRYVLSLLLSLDEERKLEERTPVEQLAGMSLAQYLEKRPAPEGMAGRVLVFDQFEDILTLDLVDPAGRQVKKEFFSQVGAVLRNRLWWALFSMREEFRAGLDPYLRLIPTRLSATYRLELLEVTAALEAIREPAHAAGVKFPESLARELVDDLRTVRVPEERKGDFVEPVHLQLVCLRIWNRLPPGCKEIREEDIEGAKTVDEALTGHYDDSVEAAAQAPGGSHAEQIRRENDLREWFGSKLIKGGVRDQVLRSQEDGLCERSLAKLVDAYLVRADERRGMIWHELTHDRLIYPILRSNQRWFRANLSPLQRQAELWKSKNESPGFLIHGEALEEAEKWAAANETGLSPLVKKFLEECRETRAAEEKERKTARRFRLLALTASAAAVLAISASVAAFIYGKQAYELKRELKRASVNLVKAAAQQVKPVEISQGIPSTFDQDSPVEGSREIVEELKLLTSALQAKTRLGQIPGSKDFDERRRAITLRYFAKPMDSDQVTQALTPFGFTLDLQESSVSALPTNAILFGQTVPLSEVRLIALVLIEAGINIQGIQPFWTPTPSNISKITIAGNAALKSLPGITPGQIDGLSRAGIPPRLTIQCLAWGETSAALLRDTLEPLGQKLVITTYPTEAATNAIWFGADAPLEEVRRVARALIDAGVELQGIQPFANQQAQNSLMIQVGHNPSLEDLPAINDEQIESLNRNGILRRRP